MHWPGQHTDTLTNLAVPKLPTFFLFEGPDDLDKQPKRSIPHCKYQACQTDMEVDTSSILQASPSPPQNRFRCIEPHRICSRVAVQGAMQEGTGAKASYASDYESIAPYIGKIKKLYENGFGASQMTC